jgi:peptide chain release factor subunit 1
MSADLPKVLVLTPVKDAARHLERYLGGLERLAYPAEQLSIGFLESDSTDWTFDLLAAQRSRLEARCRRVTLTHWDFGFHIPDGVPRWAPPFQLPRRVVLAKARNRLLFAALDDEDWVLWLDVDVYDYPSDVLTQMLATGKDVVNPHCVTQYGGTTFDWNAWRDKGQVRMDALRGSDLVRLDAVGAAMLFIRADLHREGLIFPPFLYGGLNRFARDVSPLTGRGVGEVESEALGLMAKDMGYECWGMPNLEVVHINE